MKLQKKILKQYKARIPFVLFFLLLMTGCTKGPSFFEFTTEKVDRDIVEDLKKIKNLPHPRLLYSDTIYEVWKTCSGEWGGTVYFKNKKTNKIYNARATCPVSVNRINNKYYISNSLSHLSGSSDIMEVIDPEKMEQATKIPVYYPDIITREYESHSSKGTKKLIESFGTLIMSSFVYKQKLYSILLHYDTNQVTISELRDNKFYTIQEIDKDLFSDDPLIIKKSENYQKIYLQHPNPRILEINENKIRFISYTKSKK
ncbi:hypothetical protein CQ022_15955 [Chryseobacterium culicis]|uniref:Lipoprotein n=1 Tax=Chryseobacterium culicis TaxID=680127 RepID=A0A2S9CSX6_CHRCI|nr:hypothetical protein CQ022_15955 [Chryseobacterium culicis]PRB89834.1 hypothetical protein CQ033_14850 [Chryseobacterium culicis]